MNSPSPVVPFSPLLGGTRQYPQMEEKKNINGTHIPDLMSSANTANVRSRSKSLSEVKIPSECSRCEYFSVEIAPGLVIISYFPWKTTKISGSGWFS